MEAVFAYNNSDDFDEKVLLENFSSLLDGEDTNDGGMSVELYVFCPFCPSVKQMDTDDRHGPELEYNYVTHPMVWCSIHCCRSVLLKNTAKIMTNVAREYIDKIDTYIDEINKINDTHGRTDINLSADKLVFFSVKLAFIKKMTDHIIGAFECKDVMPDDVAREFSDAHTSVIITPNKYSTEFLDVDKHRHDIELFLATNEIAKKYNVKYRADKSNERAIKYADDMKILNLGLDVGSYDAYGPVKPYPKSTNTDHDGVVIRLLCVDENGKEFIMKFWGD